MGIAIYQVDAFASRVFTGNPAAVCLLDEPADPAWMQSVASEMNLAETAFVVPGEDAFGLRWFTPTVEVELCGHATLAAAHTLWETGRIDPASQALFDTQVSGRLICRRVGQGIEMDFPADPPSPCDLPVAVADALAVRPVSCHRGKFDYLIELETEEAVRGLAPDYRTLSGLPVRGVMATAPGSDYDFVSRFFAPGSGIDEDAATGSAHCCLTPFWAKRLGKTEMRAFQASARGAEFALRAAGDRVWLGGNAITVTRGELLA